MAAPRRDRPQTCITLPKDIHGRLFALRDGLPGSTVSGIIEECLKFTLPMFEAAADAWKEAQGDETDAKKRMASWLGAQMLDVSDKQGWLYEALMSED